MLRTLKIDNYALIHHVELDFTDGLTIITGETGSGKSIMLGALGLIKGERADAKAVGRDGNKTVVEAVFEHIPGELKGFFDKEQLDWDSNELIIRREMQANGRSRAFINDTPVNLSQLGYVSSRLIDIHTQHENQLLTDSDHQLTIIDVFSDNAPLREEYRDKFEKALNIRKKLKTLRREYETLQDQRKMLEFQYAGLSELNPKKGELKEIERRFEMASSADEIKARLSEFVEILGKQDDGVVDSLYRAQGISEKGNFNKFIKVSGSEEESIDERLASLIAELRDILGIAEDAMEKVDANPALMEKLSARMQAYYEAIRQFKVTDADQLEELKNDIEDKLGKINGDDKSLLELERQSKEMTRELKGVADRLTESRREGASLFVERVVDAARPMGLPNLEFEVRIDSEKFYSTGQDVVAFYCSFNKNQSKGLLDKIASGGELSRLMLAIKSVLAGRISMPTVIFDEIDTGVSGEIADKMGDMMLGIAGKLQVMAVTHLPQVAAKGRKHFKVYKKDAEDYTETFVEELTPERRIEEIASMMSGKDVSEAAKQNAKNLLDNG